MKIREYALAGMIFLAGAYQSYSEENKKAVESSKPVKKLTLEEISKEHTEKVSEIFKRAQKRLSDYEQKQQKLIKKYVINLKERNKLLKRLKESYEKQIKRIRDMRLFMPRVSEFQTCKEIEKVLKAYDTYKERLKVLQEVDVDSNKEISKEEAEKYLEWIKLKNSGKTDQNFKKWYEQKSLEVNIKDMKKEKKN